jgi:tRNA (guanine26-N2/guanine27-N2)-dimethyltransferase
LKLVQLIEGKTKLLVPRESLEQPAPPTFPVFFNPAAAANRTVSVALASASGASTFCDSMCGVGSRGVRIANEVDGVEAVTLVDFNRESLKVARRAASLNRVARRCGFVACESTSYLASRYGKGEKFDCVDVDPFGSPARQIPAALGATAKGGILSVTATDTAALCGVYPAVSRRRYGSTPLNNHFHHETAVRILAGSISRQGAAVDLGVTPAAAHATRHYVRVYVRVEVGAAKAEASLRNSGFVVWGPECGHTATSDQAETVCPTCGRKAKSAGPLWIGPIVEEALVRKGAEIAVADKLAQASAILGSLAGVDGFPPWSFSIDRVCSTLKVPTVPEGEVRTRLESRGYKTMRQPFEETGLKTDAGYDEVEEAVAEAARRPSQK